MTRATGSFADECGGAADKSSVSSGSDNHESFTTFDSRGGITSVSFVFINGKRFSGDGRLIDLDESVFGDDTTVRRNNCTFFDLNDITGNDVGGFDFDEGAVSEGNGFKCESLFQLFDDGTSLKFLNKTDCGVEE
jgi:hypothetical protein